MDSRRWLAHEQASPSAVYLFTKHKWPIFASDSTILSQEDPQSASRKKDHIDLAFQSVVQATESDSRFYYEPMLAAHPTDSEWPIDMLGKKMRFPLWISSMTGGTEMAGTINRNLARAANAFGLGMGLGSCRNLLYSDTHLPDFQLRELIGAEQPFYANLGIAQIEELLAKKETERITDMLGKLEADGLIIHVNPMQEWLQPEGDRFQIPAIETIEQVLKTAKYPIIVKEVGQGMGPDSLKRLLQLPLAAVDFGALGGTNFARLEMHRANNSTRELFQSLALTGHTAFEMIQFVNDILNDSKNRIECREVIVSGGMQGFLDGYAALGQLQCKAVYAQGSAFLKHAMGDYSDLETYIDGQTRGLLLAKAFLKVR